MTILIGARLDDGRKVLVADGNVFRGDNECVTRYAVKVRAVHSGKLLQRKALVGCSGDRGSLNIVCDVVTSYLNTTSPEPVDLGYRLMSRVKELGLDWESNALVWMPSMHSDDYILVSIDGAMYAHVVEHQHFWAEGSGRTHALGAYLGLVLHERREDFAVTLKDKLQGFRPSIYHVQTCFDVACINDAHCGGEQTVLAFT